MMLGESAALQCAAAGVRGEARRVEITLAASADEKDRGWVREEVAERDERKRRRSEERRHVRSLLHALLLSCGVHRRRAVGFR